MENSFFEYRDKTGAASESDSEIIDNSLLDESFAPKKTPFKNRTVFVAESEESSTGDEDSNYEEPDDPLKPTKSVLRRSSAHAHVISSSEDDTSNRGSIRRQSESSSTKIVVSSSDEEEEEGSPEMLPKRRPPTKKSISPVSFIRKNKKRMILESDTDNSIIIEHDRHRKLTCMKDTPLKIDGGGHRRVIDSDVGEDNSDDGCEEKSDIGKESGDEKIDNGEESSDEKTDNGDKSGDEKTDNDEESGDEKTENGDESEDLDEDRMLMSRATRMSIMGVIPKDDSDDSDFIQSDSNSRASSRASTRSSLSELPDVSHSVLFKNHKPETDNDSSRLTCSPFSSPHNTPDITSKKESNVLRHKNDNERFIDLTNIEMKNKVIEVKDDIRTTENKENIDDDVTIIDSKPEIIALSSDDEDEEKTEKSPMNKSPKLKKEKEDKPKDNTLRQYLIPPSYPSQPVYVKKHVRENELSKLEGLKEDLHNVRHILERMDVTTLPDGGTKIIQRLTALEVDVRRQGDKVANMLVEPDDPTAEDISKDGFDKTMKGLSWDDLQKASNAVQPRMFGKQAMSTHMAERNLILDRLRSLHESLASRPADAEAALAPKGLKATLMPHQLQALAWLRWRETQRPIGGILADDMGLGKTITMISLVVSDKESNIDDNDEDDEYDRGSSKLVRGGTLVVCPASLVAQWAREVGQHCVAHALAVTQHHGAARAQQPHRLASSDIVITTYNILQRDNEKNGVLMRVRWRRVILDEAHVVRNHKAATSAAVCALKGARRWALSGTPVQNKDLDLFALLKFLRCTPFDDLTMWKKWIDNKSQGGQDRLSTIMRCILLRRTKQQLQQNGQLKNLPEKTSHQCQVTLTQPEMNVYQKVLVFSKTLFAQFLHQRAEKHADAQGFLPPEKDTAYAKMHKKMIALQGAKPVKSHEILVLLLRLRQVCCHCGLIAAMLDADADADAAPNDAGEDLLAELNKLSLADKRKSGGKDEQEEEGEGTTAAEAIRSVLSPHNPVFDLRNQSSKIRAVMDCLNENVFCNNEDKAVVVSQWTSVLSLVERELNLARVKSVTLSGSVAVPARQALVDSLNNRASNVRVMLLSLCAGGVGLNLCGASHLLLLDPHWNPQLEEQAQDRVYRVGQTKPVHIYRFMCVDTVEQSIRKLQLAKLELADNVLTGARNTNASKLTIEDLKVLFNMGQ